MWEVLDTVRTVQVVPEDDLVGHDTEGKECVCGPAIDFSGQRPLVIHDALDGRE